MQILETKDNYVYRLDRAVRVKNSFDVEIEEGIIACFGAFGRQDRDRHIKLVELRFSKDWFSRQDAELYWSEYELRYYEKKYSWNKKIPFAYDIIEFEPDRYIAVLCRDSEKDEKLSEQFKVLEELETYEDEDYMGEEDFLETLAPVSSEKFLLSAFNLILYGDKKRRDDYSDMDEDLFIAALGYLSSLCVDATPNAADIAEFEGVLIHSILRPRPDLAERVDTAFGCIPRVLQIMIFAENDTDYTTVSKELYESFSSAKRAYIDKTINWAFSLPFGFEATFEYEDGGACACKYDPAEHIAFEDEMRAELTLLLEYGGFLTFRYKRTADGPDCLSGILARNKKLEGISGREMKEMTEGSHEWNDTIEYRRAEIFF